MATRSSSAPAAPERVWPRAAAAGVVEHREHRFAWVARWWRRSARAGYALLAEAAGNSVNRWPYSDAAALVVLACVLQPAATPAAGDPTQAYVNFIIQAVIMIIAIIVVVALTPKPPMPKPAALSDFDAPTAEEGKPFCKVFGEAWVRDPNVLWYGDLSSEPIRKKGGKK